MRRRELRCGCESLEERALLSVAHANVHAVGHHLALHHKQQAAMEVGQLSPSATTPSIVASAAAATSDSDISALQSAASANNLETFLAQLSMFGSGGSSVQQAALTILNQDRDLDLQLHALADAKGTVVPSDISPSDQPIAQQIVSSVGSSGVDQTTFLNATIQAATQRVSQLQGQVSAAQDADVKTFLQSDLALAQSHLAIEQALLAGSSSAVGSAPSTTPSSTSLNSTDLQILESSYSTTLTERFLAQFTDLESDNSKVQKYAEKLIDDHEQEALEIGRYASATSTYLPANIQGMNVQTSVKVLSAANRRRYDTNYLSTMVRSHTMDIQDNRQTLVSTQNPTLLQFATDDIPTDFLHRSGAQFLLRR